MDQEFIYRQQNGSVSEVLTAEELTRLALNALITEETLVANPGWENWTAAWRVPFLQYAFNLSFHEVPPAPLPGEEDEPVRMRRIGPAAPKPEPPPEPVNVPWEDFLLST